MTMISGRFTKFPRVLFIRMYVSASVNCKSKNVKIHSPQGFHTFAAKAKKTMRTYAKIFVF